jgi:hypothetical protein
MCVFPAWQALGAQACRVNTVQGSAGLGVVAQQNGDHVCLYLWRSRPWGCGPAAQRSCRAVQAWGGAWPGGDRKCLWIPGLKGLFHGYPVVLRGGSLG